jgi:hypothetical protein
MPERKLFAVAAIAAFLALAWGFAHKGLQRPAPGPSAVSQHEQAASESNQHDPTPANCIASACGSNLDKGNAGHEGSKQDNKASSKWPDILGVATFIVLVFQAWIYSRQREVMQRQADIAAQQIKLSENVERPYLFFKMVKTVLSADELTVDYMKRAEKVGQARYYVNFELLNHGRTPAMIESIQTTMEVHPFLPPEPNYSSGMFEHNAQIDRVIDGKDKSATLETYIRFTPDDFLAYQRGVKNIFLYGRIVYKDMTGAEYQTAFGYRALTHGSSTKLIEDGREAYNYRT